MPEDLKDILMDSSQMTPVVTAVPGAGSGPADNSSGSSQINSTVTPDTPSFQVPGNPLLPPGYQETLDYSSLQYVNGFYRTQIGRYVRVDQLVGNNLTQQEGFLIGVGYNYILLQEGYTNNILVVDIYSIKNMYVFYHNVIPAYADSLPDAEETDI